MLIWVDGLAGPHVSASDRGLAYGDGLFETIAVRTGVPLLLEEHIARLWRGCNRLSIPFDINEVGSEVGRFAQCLGNGVAKLIVTRGDGQRGYAVPEPPLPRRILVGSAPPHYPESNYLQGIALYDCQTRLAEQPLLAGLKHLNRLEQVLARSEWSGAHYAEGLMRDTSGRVVEGIFSNVFVVSGQHLITPSLERCGVAGVMRDALISQARQAGIVCTVEDLPIEVFLEADEVFTCNSVYGIWPVTQFNDRRWPVGDVTRKMQSISCRLLEANA
jgi:4-amino-4-deoxychorismate lyase